jgi:hypothetical protein
MTRSEFLAINDLPCRIKLKSGKEVYGVIWEKKSGSEQSYYFASLNERFSRAPQSNSQIGMMIILDEVVGAELINNSGALVG